MLPLQNNEPKRKWDPISQWVLFCAGAYKHRSLFQQGKRPKQGLLRYFKNSIPELCQTYENLWNFTALSSAEDPNGLPSGTKTGEVSWSLKERRGNSVLHMFPCFYRTTGQKENKSHLLSLAHRCLQLEYSKEERMKTELWDSFGKIFCLLEIDTFPKRIINNKKFLLVKRWQAGVEE